MRALALHADLIVFVSDVWQTTCTAIRSGSEGFVIDSPVYPEELRALPEVLAHAGFPVTGLLTTHGDWDHLLGRCAFPEAALGCAPATADRLAARIGEPQRELRSFDEEHYVAQRPALSLGSLQPLPVPGRLAIGEGDELELYPAEGHTADGVAYWVPWLRTLVCGDYLSPVEIPAISPGGSLPAYAATLARLEPLLALAEWVVPGHGAPVDARQARVLHAQDGAYVAALADDPGGAEPPPGRDGRAQRRLHAENLAAIGAGPDRAR